VIKWPPNYQTVAFWPPPLVKTIKLDEKCKTMSFFEVKLLKCPFEGKNQFKKCPPPPQKKNDVVLKKEKRRRRRRRRRRNVPSFTYLIQARRKRFSHNPCRSFA
jgi:hypothetical protein